MDDEFGTPEPLPAPLISGGRYRLPNRDGSHHAGGWQRVTNLVAAYSDQYALRVWEHLEVMHALTLAPSVLAGVDPVALKALPFRGRVEAVEEWLNRAKDVSGGSEGARHGNLRHAAVEGYHEGLPTAHLDIGTQKALRLYAAALEDAELSPLPGMQERILMIESLDACGRVDNVLTDRRRSMDVIGDLKTQKRFWTWLEIAAQLACYAHATAMWDADTLAWVDPPAVSREVAMVLWMPREREHVEVREVDIVAGWRTARRARDVVLDRAAAKSTRSPRAWLRPAKPPSEVAAYARRFAEVESVREGRALSVEIRERGLWCEIIEDASNRALTRLLSS